MRTINLKDGLKRFMKTNMMETKNKKNPNSINSDVIKCKLIIVTLKHYEYASPVD